MATTLFPVTTASDYSKPGIYTGMTKKLLDFSRGSGATTITDNSVATLQNEPVSNTGTGAIVGSATGTSITAATNPSAGTVFISPPLAAVTISGTVTGNFRGLESAGQANYGGSLYVVWIRGNFEQFAWALVCAGGNTTELGTSEVARNFTMTPTSSPILNGDRLAVFFCYGSAGGTSASGRTASFFYAGASGASGDSFITFTETIAAASPMHGPEQGEGRSDPFALQALDRVSVVRGSYI